MSFLKNILSPFVEFDDKKKGAATKEPAAPSESQSAPPVSKTPTDAPAYTPSAGTAAASQYQKYFDNLIEEANAKNPLFAGTDFKEFMDSKIDVEAIPDEAMRYRTAFNVLRRTGLTKEKLLTTGRAYLDLINRDLKGFEGAYAQQYKAEVETKEQLLQQKAAELQALNEKITALNAEMKSLSQAVKQSKENLNRNKESFLQAGEEKKKEIETELEKIERYFS